MIDPAYYSASSPSPGGRAGSPAPYYPYSPSPYSPSVYSASASRRRFSGGGNDYDDDDDDLQESDEDEYDRANSYSNHRNSYQSYATTTPTSAHGHGGGPDLSRPYTDAEGRLHDPAFRLFDVEIAPHVREKRAQQRSASANTVFSSYTAGGGRAASPSLYAHSLAPSTNQNHATKQKSKLQYGAVAQQLSPPSDSSAVRPASYDPLLGTSTMRSLDADEYEDAEDGYAGAGESPEYASALDHAASHSHLAGVGIGIGVIGPSPVSPSTVNADAEHEHEARTDSGYGASPASPAGPVRSSIGMATTDSSSGVKGPSTMGTTTTSGTTTTTSTTGGMITAAESSMHTSTNAEASPSAGAGATAASSVEQHDVDQAQHVNSQHQHQQEHATPQLQKRILSIHLDAPTPTPPSTRPGTPGRSGTGGSTTLPYRPHPVRELSRSTLYPRPVVDSTGGSNTAFGVGFHSNPHSRLPSAPSLLIPNSPQARSVSSSSLSSGGGGDVDAKRRGRRRRARDALSMMPEGYYSDEDEDNPFKPVVVTPLPASSHQHAHGGSSHGHGLGTKTLVPGLHAPSKTKVAAKVKAKKDELKREIFHSGTGIGEAEKSTSSGAHPHPHSSHPARGQLSRAVSTISGDEGGVGEKRASRHGTAHGRLHSHSRSRPQQQQHLHQGQRAGTPSRELSLARESSAGAVSGGGGRLGYVPSHHGKSVSLRPGVQVIEDDYAYVFLLFLYVGCRVLTLLRIDRDVRMACVARGSRSSSHCALARFARGSASSARLQLSRANQSPLNLSWYLRRHVRYFRAPSSPPPTSISTSTAS